MTAGEALTAAGSGAGYSRTEQLMRRLTLLRPGEGRSVLYFSLYAFLLLVAYYILKTLREPLLLAKASAEMKSYAYATIALLLLVAIPLYGQIFRRTDGRRLTRWVTGFFIATLLVFYALGRAGFDIGFAYYVWVGIASLMLTAQFWGYAASSYNLISGKRLFPVIMLGATAGGLVGPGIAGALYPVLGAWKLMLCVGLLLAATLPLVERSLDAVPEGSRYREEPDESPRATLMGGLGLVFRDRYLQLLAALIVLLNWVNTTGEYLLAELVIAHADARILADPTLVKDQLIAAFYGKFYFVVNALTVAIQVSLVARVFRWIGLRGAILVLPLLACLGYGAMIFVPIFSVIALVKVLENATDYSLMNTARHALYLPLTTSHKFEGKTAVETFFWRLGDLLQAGVIFVGLHWLSLGTTGFALINLVLSAIWVFIALRLGAGYRTKAASHSTDRPPRFSNPLPPAPVPGGRAFRVALPRDCFTDPDPGDVLTIRARQADGSPLPDWIRFDPDTLVLSGMARAGLTGDTAILLIARDFDGKEAQGQLVLRHERPA